MQSSSFLQVLSAIATLSFPNFCRASEPPAAAVQHSCVFETVPGVHPTQRLQRYNGSTRLSGAARLSSAALELTVANGDEEELTLCIPRSQLTADLTGHYRLANPPFDTTGVRVRYCYRAAGASGEPVRVYSNLHELLVPASGSVIITGYNSQSQGVSGSYYVSLEFVPGPKNAANEPANWRIQLTGQFDNLRVQ